MNKQDPVDFNVLFRKIQSNLHMTSKVLTNSLSFSGHFAVCESDLKFPKKHLFSLFCTYPWADQPHQQHWIWNKKPDLCNWLSQLISSVLICLAYFDSAGSCTWELHIVWMGKYFNQSSIERGSVKGEFGWTKSCSLAGYFPVILWYTKSGYHQYYIA